MRKISILWKIYLTLVLVAVLPVIISSLQLIISYQGIIDKIIRGELSENFGALQENLFIQGVLTILFFIIIITTFGALLLTRYLLSPLKKIVKEMKAVAQGKLDVSLKSGRKDEFGELIQSFNVMVDETRKSQTALKEAKNVSEIKIQARTRELKELAESLDDKVKKRTEELQVKLKELERFQRLTIGRELKMVDLKKELGNLKKILEEKTAAK